MTDTELHRDTLLASAAALLLLEDMPPGSAVYVAIVLVDGFTRGYRVVPASAWPDLEWQDKAQDVLAEGDTKRVRSWVELVLRKPVTAPPEVASHMFIVGHMRASSVHPPGVH